MRRFSELRDAGLASLSGFATPAFALLALAALAAPLPAEDTSIEVRVVAVLATSEHTKIDPRLKHLASEVKKTDPSLTGFEVDSQNKKSMKIGETATFALVDKTEATVTLKERDESGCVAVQVKVPTFGEVTYSCCCGKYVPLLTRYETKDKKKLVVAVMVQACKKKEPDKPAKPRP
jgi:hypothetical protein